MGDQATLVIPRKRRGRAEGLHYETRAASGTLSRLPRPISSVWNASGMRPRRMAATPNDAFVRSDPYHVNGVWSTVQINGYSKKRGTPIPSRRG